MLQEKAQRNGSEIAYDEGIRKGIRKGRKEGRPQGRIELLEEQWATKCGPLDDSVIWATRLLTAETPGDVLE